MNFRTLIERLLQLIPVLLGAALVVFLMTTLTPGDPVEIMLGNEPHTAEQEAALRRDMGLDLPLHERFVLFIANAATGNFGLSFFHRRPVSDVIFERRLGVEPDRIARDDAAAVHHAFSSSMPIISR